VKSKKTQRLLEGIKVLKKNSQYKTVMEPSNDGKKMIKAYRYEFKKKIKIKSILCVDDYSRPQLEC